MDVNELQASYDELVRRKQNLSKKELAKRAMALLQTIRAAGKDFAKPEARERLSALSRCLGDMLHDSSKVYPAIRIAPYEPMRQKVFIGTTQNDMEPERLALVSLLSTDPFLGEHFEPVLPERLSPAALREQTLDAEKLRRCQVYLLILDLDSTDSGLSVSGGLEEYELAVSMQLPVLVLVKGVSGDSRNRKTQALFHRIKSDGQIYRRYATATDAKVSVSVWLRQVLAAGSGIEPTPSEIASAEDTIEAISPFESTQQTDVTLDDLDNNACKLLFTALTGKDTVDGAAMHQAFRTRSLLWQDGGTGDYFPTAAGVVVLARNPAIKYLQCQVLADAYPDTKVTSNPLGQAMLSGPIPQLIENLLAFVHKHTFHPTRVVGINNIALDEYPRKAVREAFVNAFAHRDYADTGRKIRIEVFRDRLVVSSPGYLPRPLTISKLRRGNYESCRRNPVIAECLAALNLMEQRGTGFERMRASMIDHGLAAPEVEQENGYFKLTLPGANGDFARLRVPGDAQGLVPPSVEAKLNEAQKAIMVQVQTEGSVTSGWCRKTFGVALQSVYRDLRGLVDAGLLRQTGSGRGIRYVIGGGRE
jgi:ATP-dependent DNA helicase RecG